MSLLTLIQNACGLLSLAKPLQVITSNDLQVRLLLGLAQEEGEELRKGGDLGHNWDALIEEETFTTQGAPAQTTAIPTDFDHFIPDTFYNRTTRRKVWGPITPQQWQAIQAQPALNRVYLSFRSRGGQFLITPTPPVGQTIAYEYLSKNWVKAQDGTPQSSWLADTDSSYLSEHLMLLGIRWRFLKSKGLDYGEDFSTYQRQVEIAIARDRTSRALTMVGRDCGRLDNIQEGDFPSQVA